MTRKRGSTSAATGSDCSGAQSFPDFAKSTTNVPTMTTRSRGTSGYSKEEPGTATLLGTETFVGERRLETGEPPTIHDEKMAYLHPPPPTSRPGSAQGASVVSVASRQKYFKSRRVNKSEITRPWLDKKDPREKWVTIIPVIGLLMGLAVSGLMIWLGMRSVINHKYCPVLDENFAVWNDNVWSKEVQVDGYGNGQFEMTTNTDENVFIRDGMLVIKPTLQKDDLVETNNVMDLRLDGCTGTDWTQCVTTTNITNGTIINPVKSGRVNTKRGASIKYGRVEVVAKLPVGDWLWPAIWMLPTNSVYGPWPRSGEIDIMESRGNNYTYKQGGNNIISSTLHFGPNEDNDGWWRNNRKQQALHSTFADAWHTYGLEWSENYLYTYIDTRLMQVIYTQFTQPFFEYGRFPLTDSNGTRLRNPWLSANHTTSNASPFDQDFYLVLDVAVGGTNGWFDDGKSNKPWIDGSPSARKDFWNARDDWEPTWGREEEGKREMQIKSVKMWQQAGYNGCF